MIKNKSFIIFLSFFIFNHFTLKASDNRSTKPTGGGPKKTKSQEASAPSVKRKKVDSKVIFELIEDASIFADFYNQVHKTKEEKPDLFVGIDDIFSGILNGVEESIHEKEAYLVLVGYNNATVVSFAIAQKKNISKWSLDLILSLKRSAGLGRRTLDTLIKIIRVKESQKPFTLDLEATQQSLPWYKSLGFSCDEINEEDSTDEDDFIDCSAEITSQTKFFTPKKP